MQDLKEKDWACGVELSDLCVEINGDFLLHLQAETASFGILRLCIYLLISGNKHSVTMATGRSVTHMCSCIIDCDNTVHITVSYSVLLCVLLTS